jgi:hypothetical protein
VSASYRLISDDELVQIIQSCLPASVFVGMPCEQSDWTCAVAEIRRRLKQNANPPTDCHLSLMLARFSNERLVEETAALTNEIAAFAGYGKTKKYQGLFREALTRLNRLD